MLDQDLILRHLREQLGNACAQHLLNVDPSLRHDALGAQVVAGVVVAFPLAMHHLQMLSLIEAFVAADALHRKVLQEVQIQGAAVAVAGRSQHGGIVRTILVEQGQDSLCPVVIVKEHHSLGGALDAVLGGRRQFADSMKECLTRLDWQLALGRFCQCLQLRQCRRAGAFEQIHQQPGARDLAHEAYEVLCVRQDVCALIGSMFTRTFCCRLARRQLGAFLCC
ncbi:hypothetical protein SDC9_143345 [bioreactor metagenome]|uniref:Uncharacterized protein n=1 Tax=bioreactor metagenome TaxID=1076179 RepID=A0A645E3A4_9ZZZZ